MPHHTASCHSSAGSDHGISKTDSIQQSQEHISVASEWSEVSLYYRGMALLTGPLPLIESQSQRIGLPIEVQQEEQYLPLQVPQDLGGLRSIQEPWEGRRNYSTTTLLSQEDINNVGTRIEWFSNYSTCNTQRPKAKTQSKRGFFDGVVMSSFCIGREKGHLVEKSEPYIGDTR